MAEEIKKPKVIDPNSAKFKLGKIAGDTFASAIEAKKEGIPVAHGFQVTFQQRYQRLQASLLHILENQAAGIAARGAGEECAITQKQMVIRTIFAHMRE